jgi:hypothetical protein
VLTKTVLKAGFLERDFKRDHLADTYSDGDFGKYFHLPVSVNFSKWILFTGKLPVVT